MFLKFVICGGLILGISGCAAVPLLAVVESQKQPVLTEASEPYNASTQAQLRIYYDAANIISYPNKSCESWKKSKFKNYFNAVATSLPKSETYKIGMLPTEASIAIVEQTTKRGIQNVFQETVINANEPYVLDARFVDAVVTNTACQVSGEFTPKAGEQYEARYTHTRNSCSLSIHKIQDSVKQQVYSLDSKNLIRSCL